jgi:hypothetical protein
MFLKVSGSDDFQCADDQAPVAQPGRAGVDADAEMVLPWDKLLAVPFCREVEFRLIRKRLQDGREVRVLETVDLGVHGSPSLELPSHHRGEGGGSSTSSSTAAQVFQEVLMFCLSFLSDWGTA